MTTTEHRIIRTTSFYVHTLYTVCCSSSLQECKSTLYRPTFFSLPATRLLVADLRCRNVITHISNLFITSNISIFTGCCDNGKVSYLSDDKLFMFKHVLQFVAVRRCRNVKIQFIQQSSDNQKQINIYGLLELRQIFISFGR